MEGSGPISELSAPPAWEPVVPGDIAAALGWWREAGVDLAFADSPTAWLAPAAAVPLDAPPPPVLSPPPAPVQPAAAALPAAIGGDAAHWPVTLDAFAPWWLSEPSLDNGIVRGRIPPRGPAGAELMVIVPQPEAADTDTLLSGREGTLLAAMLAAMGLGPAQVYLASALPRHTPLPDWAGLGRAGLGEVLARHVALVAPRRLIALGDGVLSLLGHNRPQTTHDSLRFNHENGMVRLLGARDLAAMMSRPAWKAAFWRAWLEFERGEAADQTGTAATHKTGNDET